MGSITLELIAAEAEETLTLPLSVHVHKRVERFRYLPHVRDGAVPLYYLESKSLDSWENIQISNRTYGIPVNAPRVVHRRLGWTEVQGVAYASEYKEIAITDVLSPDSEGINRPLFWKHKLPDSTTEATLYRVAGGNKQNIDSGYSKDLDAGYLYTNYRNAYDPDTGTYSVYYVVSVDASGVSTHSLLNPTPVVVEATWEDIDLDTGELQDGLKVFTREQSSSGYTYYLNSAGPWYVRPLDGSLVQPKRPTGKTARESWFLRFSNGNFSALTNGQVRRYRVPEYDLQPFFPSKPNLFSPYQNVLRVNKRILSLTRKNLAIDPDKSLHLTISVYDSGGLLVRVLTTDESLSGQRYHGTEVYYETDQLLCWDNSSGLVVAGFDLLPEWNYEASYYYKADDYEYTGISLNPIENPDIQKAMCVYYMVPDVLDSENAIHHLLVDQTGLIAQASQGPGNSYKNLQLLNSDGTWNSDTVIGKKYGSDEVTDTFLDLYTVGYNNSYAYYVLAEVVVGASLVKEDLEVIDLRGSGGGIREDSFESAVRRNPRLLQSRYGYGENGQEVPKNSVMVLDIPISITEDYGGDLSEEQAINLLNTYMPASGYSVANWVYPASTLTGTSTVSGSIELTWTWEGPTQTYSLYRRLTSSSEWELLDTQVSPAEAQLTYTDVVTSGETYTYGVRITESGVEFPFGNSLTVRAK